MQGNQASLYSRLGGYDSIAAMVDDLLPRLRSDELLGRFWVSPRSVDTHNRERQLAVDFIAAAQAFHWFDPSPTRREFQRFLKPGGRVIVLWNERLLDDTPFLRAYEELLQRFGTDYSRVSESYPRAGQMHEFFGANEFTSHSLPNAQEFDFEGLSGRLRSSSYAPAPDHPQFAPMMEELHRIFDSNQKDGVVCMEYRTRIYAGKLDSIG